MICRITWTNSNMDEQEPHIVDFALKDYYLSYDNTSGFIHCTLLYYFGHEQEILFENAILQHDCHIENIELIINDLSSHSYSQFNNISSYLHQLNTIDGTPNIILEIR